VGFGKKQAALPPEILCKNDVLNFSFKKEMALKCIAYTVLNFQTSLRKKQLCEGK